MSCWKTDRQADKQTVWSIKNSGSHTHTQTHKCARARSASFTQHRSQTLSVPKIARCGQRRRQCESGQLQCSLHWLHGHLLPDGVCVCSYKTRVTRVKTYKTAHLNVVPQILRELFTWLQFLLMRSRAARAPRRQTASQTACCTSLTTYLLLPPGHHFGYIYRCFLLGRRLQQPGKAHTLLLGHS